MEREYPSNVDDVLALVLEDRLRGLGVGKI
jgi:hypothetical protein